MMQPLFGAPEPSSRTYWHPGADVLSGYAEGAVDEIGRWSVETHLQSCSACRAAVSAHVDRARLARNRAVVLAMTATPDVGVLSRAASRCGIPDHVLRLMAATPSLRRSWLLAVVGVLTVVTGEAVLARDLWPGGGRVVAGGAGRPGLTELAPFLLVGPLLALAGVAAAFLPVLDPSYRLAVAAPISGVRLLLIRSLSALLGALMPVVCAAVVMPGPSWLPVAVLLPSLAVCAIALAALTTVGPTTAVIAAGAAWVAPLVWLGVTRFPAEVIQGDGQILSALVLIVATLVMYLRRDRLEMGLVR